MELTSDREQWRGKRPCHWAELHLLQLSISVLGPISPVSSTCWKPPVASGRRGKGALLSRHYAIAQLHSNTQFVFCTAAEEKHALGEIKSWCKENSAARKSYVKCAECGLFGSISDSKKLCSGSTRVHADLLCGLCWGHVDSMSSEAVEIGTG
jgi:hypothetical protein